MSSAQPPQPRQPAAPFEEANTPDLDHTLIRFARLCGLDRGDGIEDVAMTTLRIDARLEALSRDNPAYFYALYQFHRALEQLGLEHPGGQAARDRRH